MPYWLMRLDDQTYEVMTSAPPPGEPSFETELSAHQEALRQLLEHRGEINASIKETRRRIRACQ